jgi:hypothetical protein
MDAMVAPLALGGPSGAWAAFGRVLLRHQCHAPWAVTFTDPDALRFSGTPLFHPLHGADLLQSHQLQHPQDPAGAGGGAEAWCSAYFILEGLGRMLVQTAQGPGPGVWTAAVVHQPLTAQGFVLFGIGVLAWAKRHQTTERRRPDGHPPGHGTAPRPLPLRPGSGLPRSRWEAWIRAGMSGQRPARHQPGTRLKAGDRVWSRPSPSPGLHLEPESMDLPRSSRMPGSGSSTSPRASGPSRSRPPFGNPGEPCWAASG